MSKEMNISIDEGNVFFSHEVSLNFTPLHFYMDFKSVTPRLDVRAKSGPMLHMKHNVIMMDPFHIKEMHTLLGNVVKRYETEFGKIKRPAALERLAKKQEKASVKKETDSEAVSPNYFG